MEEDEEEVAPGIQGSCSICLGNLKQQDKLSALVCGHVYHHGCIAQWMAAKKQCPSCRRPVPKNGFVERLFFDLNQTGEENRPPEVDYAEETFKLTAELKVEKEKLLKTEDENKELKQSVKSLEKKILKEKERNKYEIPRLQATIDTLKISMEETNHLKREVKSAKDMVKACEFYKILNTHTESADKELSNYLKKNGSLHTEKFFELIKAQNKDLLEHRRGAAQEIEKLKGEKQSMQKTINDDKKIISALRKEVLDLRERANVETPMNKRLRDVLTSETPARRVSMGFDVSAMSLGDDLCYFQPVANQNQSEDVAKPGPSSAPIPSKFSFDDDSDDDLGYSIPKKKKQEEKVAPPPADDSFDFTFDIPVPQNIIKRIPAKPVLPKAKSFDELKATMTGKPPNPLKRPLISETKIDKNKKIPPVKSARISSFFVRKNSSSKLDNEYVQLD